MVGSGGTATDVVVLRPAQILHILAAADSFFADIAPSRCLRYRIQPTPPAARAHHRPRITHGIYTTRGQRHIPRVSLATRSHWTPRPTWYRPTHPPSTPFAALPTGLTPSLSLPRAFRFPCSQTYLIHSPTRPDPESTRDTPVLVPGSTPAVSAPSYIGSAV